MDDQPEVEPTVRRLWAHVQDALAANADKLGDPPSPCRIERLAAELGLELAASTVEGWFRTWSVVPKWERFETLLKVLGAEKDHEWTELYAAAHAADRRRKRKQKEQKKQKGTEGREKKRQPVQEYTVTTPARAERGITRVFQDIPGSAWAVGGGIAVVFVTITIFVVSSGFSGETPSPGTVLCTRAIVDRAEVLSKPDDRSELIKYKYFDDPIKIQVGHQSPRGWVTVRTPANEPGYNWMHRNTLGEFNPCTD